MNRIATIILTLAFGCLPGLSASAYADPTAEPGPGDSAVAAGSGTTADPYQISRLQHLHQMRNNMSAHYVLVDDIDASATASWDGGKGFSPIGDPAHPFAGSFDGQGHTISGLRIDRFGNVTTYIALFGMTAPEAVIRNLHVSKAFVKGCDYVGVLAGINQGTISHCYVSGEVYGGGTFGGLVGGNVKGRISHCAAAVNVGPVGGGNHLGGLVGTHNGGEISDCFATGSVTGNENPGGLVGVNNGGIIRRCYASGNVASSFGGASDSYRRGVGGLVAQNSAGGTIDDCLATGKVTGPAGLTAGGLVGFNTDKAAVSNSYCVRNRDTSLSAVGRKYPDGGFAEGEDVAELSATFFTPGTGPLGSWGKSPAWTWARQEGGATLPLFASSFPTSPATDPSAAETAKRSVVAELSDGSCVVGSPLRADLPFVSPLGKFQVPIAIVARVVFQADKETATLLLNNGDRLTGIVDLAAFDMAATWGRISLPLAHVRTLVLRGGPIASHTPFDAAM